MENENWLSHLNSEMLKKVRNNRFCSYLIALEGWRRGLELSFSSDKVTKHNLHSPGLRYTLSSKERTHTFYKARGDKVKGQAFSIGSNKYETKHWLAKHGIPVAKGEKFSKDVSNDQIVKYAEKIGFPVVLKPVVGAQGKGVVANIRNHEYLYKALTYVRETLNYPNVILEQYVEGKEYRIYVIEDEVIAVINRIPANVIGDGIHSIKELIENKNKKRKKNPRLYSCLIKVDFEVKNILNELGYTLDYIPKKDQQIFLREKSNISTGGDSIEVTNNFPSEIKQIAVDSLKSIENFPHGGVDIIYNANKPLDESAVVLELSPTPQIGSLVFPMQGQGRDIPAAILNFYFPETKNKEIKNSQLYFNMDSVLRPLISGSAKEVIVKPAPSFKMKSKKFVVQGKVQGVGFRKWIQKKALEYELNGFVNNLIDGAVEIVVAGKDEDINNFKKLCMYGPKSAEVSQINESIWNKPISVGFEIGRQVKGRNANNLPKQNIRLGLSQRVKRKIKRVFLKK